MKCDDCPVGGDCIGELQGWKFACGLANDGNATHRRYVIDRSAIAASEPPPPAAYPPLLTQAATAAAAAARFVGSGWATVDQAEFDRRRAICEGCPNRDPAQDRCRLCACYLAVKPWSRAETCPDGRW